MTTAPHRAASNRRMLTVRLWTLWGAIAVAVTAMLLAPARVPYYDYAEWVLQGRILRDLLSGVPDATALYTLVPVPVPNLAAPAVIALLGVVLPDEAAGRVLLVAGVLGFAAGYALLVRRLQGRATVVELTGPLWATGYFLERGYLSYLFALPIAFAGMAVLHSVLRGRPGRGRLAALAAIAVAAYLAHLVAWGVLIVGIAVTAVWLLRHGRHADAVRLAATLTPSVLLLLWYLVTDRNASGHVQLYGSLRDKALAVAEPLELFPRLDPFAGIVPPFAAQVLVVGALLAIGIAALRAGAVRAALACPVAVTALVLGTSALLDPIGNVNALTKPDQRLLFPAALMLLGALPWRPLRPRDAAAVTGVVLAATLLHAATLLSVQEPLERLAAAIAAIPAGAEVVTDALPADGGCPPQPGPTIGITALKWVDVERRLALGDLRADLQETSVVRLRFVADRRAGLTPLTPGAAQAAAAVRAAAPAQWVEIVGCDPDVGRVAADLDDGWRRVATGSGFAILRR